MPAPIDIPDGARVSALSVCAVKGMRITSRQELTLDASGAPDNRRFYLVDHHGRMVNGKRLGALTTIVPTYDDSERRLALEFPRGEVVSGDVETGPRIDTQFFSRPRPATLVIGPWADAISAHVGETVRLVESPSGAVDRGRAGGVTLISRASLGRLAEIADVQNVDARRFRMLVEIEGVAAHEEDGWVGGRLRVGTALVAVHGHVGRCAVTTRDADSGRVDLPTLDILGSYRGEADTTEPLAFGIYGAVREPGTVRVGDRVTPA